MHLCSQTQVCKKGKFYFSIIKKIHSFNIENTECPQLISGSDSSKRKNHNLRQLKDPLSSPTVSVLSLRGPRWWEEEWRTGRAQADTHWDLSSHLALGDWAARWLLGRTLFLSKGPLRSVTVLATKALPEAPACQAVGSGGLSKGLGQFCASCEHTRIIPRSHINLGWGCSVRHPQAHKLRQTSQPFPFWHLKASWSSTCKRGSYLDTPGISVVSYLTAGWGVGMRCLFF